MQPKTKAGRCDITLPDLLVEVLRDFRKAQLELRVGLGSGKLPDKALLFVGINGALPSQKYYSKAWSDFADQIGMPDLGFHNLRHTHASQLIAMPALISSPFQSAWAMPSRTSHCGSMRICLGRTTARRRRSMRR